MTQVILINPPIFYHQGNPVSLDTSFPPLGLLYLASTLKQNNISVKTLDVGAQNLNLDDTLSFIKNENAVIVGITSMTPTLQGAVTLAKSIRSKFKNVNLVLGGSHISADPDFIRRLPFFDFAIQGESELTFLNLVQQVLDGKKIRGTHLGKPAQNLDHLPWPDRNQLPSNSYLKKADLIATRGCPFNCYYCSRPAVSNCIRYRSPKDIADEMDSLYSSSGGDYLFQDDSLTINKAHIIELSEELIKRSKRYHWEGYTRIDLVDADVLSAMSQAGCHNLTFGIETGDEKLRREVVKKPFTNSQIKNVIKLCQKYHITASGFFIIGHYSETKTQVTKTIDFILKNNFDVVGVSIATPFPGSKLWDYAINDKIIDLKFIDNFALGKMGDGYAGIYPVYHPSRLKLDWLYQQRRYVMRKFYLRPKFILNRLAKDILSPQYLYADIKEGLNVLVKGSSSRAPYKKQTKYL